MGMPTRKQFMAMKEMDIEGFGTVTPGLRVRHPVFGVGEVKMLAAWADGSRTIQVEFANQGTKWLVPEYAKLTRAQGA
jgi:hypothetical protein